MTKEAQPVLTGTGKLGVQTNGTDKGFIFSIIGNLSGQSTELDKIKEIAYNRQDNQGIRIRSDDIEFLKSLDCIVINKIKYQLSDTLQYYKTLKDDSGVTIINHPLVKAKENTFLYIGFIKKDRSYIELSDKINKILMISYGNSDKIVRRPLVGNPFIEVAENDRLILDDGTRLVA